jgi:hypothetical protein
MGASQTWLILVEKNAPPLPPGECASDVLIPAYHDASEKVDRIWAASAPSAFFHHLSAIFGYVPVQLRDEISF